MRWKMMLGTMVAVGSLAATRVRAQNVAGDGTVPPAQQGDTAGNTQGDNPQSKSSGQSAKSGTSDYGAYVEGPTSVDADGVPVAKPNPIAHFEKNARGDDVPVPMPLIDDPRTDSPADGGQTK
jgi:hypothetical protein